MSKFHFLKAFDGPWKTAVEKKHCIAGFLATGLVPFNPDRVDYGKIVKSKAGPVFKSTKAQLNLDQRLGITMSFHSVKEILSPQITLFEKRIAEEYNLIDETDGNKLWRVYKTEIDAPK